MTSSQARKGRRAELAVAEALQSLGFPYCEPTRRSGWAEDRGDIDGIPGVVIEVKDAKTHKLSAWLKETETERSNADAKHGLLVVKRAGITDAAEWYAISTLRSWARLAKNAGH